MFRLPAVEFVHPDLFNPDTHFAVMKVGKTKTP